MYIKIIKNFLCNRNLLSKQHIFFFFYIYRNHVGAELLSKRASSAMFINFDILQ